jgi:hypothetical protein
MANQTTVQLKRSSVSGRVPDAANIEVGEPVVNLADKIIFTKDGTGNVIVIGAGTTSNVVEGNNLYFTDGRVATALTNQTLSNASFSSTVYVGGELTLGSVGGDEGAQINFGQATANSTLAGDTVTLDIFQNKLRIFEQGGNARGAYIDISACADGVGTNLIGGGTGTITNVAGVSSGSVSNAQLATATVTSQTLTNATFSANVTADKFISSNNGNGENYRVGDDAWIGDINLANSIRIKGNQDAANAYIVFGTGDTASLGRAGTDPLTYTGAFTATGNVIAANLLPPSDDSGSVGNAGRTWNNGHFTNLTVDTLGSVSGTLNVRTALDLGTDDVLRLGDNDDIELYYDGTNSYLDLNSGNLVFRDTVSNRATFVRHTGDLILTTGNAQANYFIGDGSALTNITVANSNITGNIISSKLEPSGVTAATYGGATSIPAIVIDQQGRITSASNVAISASGGGGRDGTFNTGINRNVGYFLTTTSAAAFIAPSTAGTEYIVHSIHVTNYSTTSGAEVTGSFDGTTYSGNIAFTNTVPVPIGTSVELLKKPKVLQPNDKIQLNANVNSVLNAVITYEQVSSTSYFGSGIDLTSAGTYSTLYTATANSVIESILLANDSGTLDVRARVVWTDSFNNIQGYYAFDIIVPADATVEVLEQPKYLESNHKIRVYANQANRLEAIISGKNQ